MYVEGFTKRSGVDTAIDVPPSDFPRLAPDLETTIFRIVQEALTNIFRHSEARKASISLLAVNGEIALKVLDDGKGMADYSMKARPDTIGVGLRGMSQRAKEFGGELRLRAGNPGTLVEVIIPAELAQHQESPATS